MILGDYHTHTIYSHGKGTIMQSVEQAAKVGLKQIAITDHGFKHRLHNVNRKKWQQIKDEIAAAHQKYPSVEVLLGLEANLLDSKGNVDVTDEDLQDLDVLICGFHLFSKSTSASEFFGFNMPVFLSGMKLKNPLKNMVLNTDAYIKAMERYPIDFISHPQYGIKVDLAELSKAAAHYGIYLELNGKRISFAPSDAVMMQQHGAQLIINSDAHTADRVGETSVPVAFAKTAGIDLDTVVNWNKLPALKNKKHQN